MHPIPAGARGASPRRKGGPPSKPRPLKLRPGHPAATQATRRDRRRGLPAACGLPFLLQPLCRLISYSYHRPAVHPHTPPRVSRPQHLLRSRFRVQQRPEPGARFPRKLERRPILDNPAAIDDQDAIEGLSPGDVMGDAEQRGRGQSMRARPSNSRRCSQSRPRKGSSRMASRTPSRSIARASRTRCPSPPDSNAPPSPSLVSKPWAASRAHCASPAHR